MAGLIRPESYSTVLVLTRLTYLHSTACLTYDNDTDFRLTLHFRISLLALCMYELHLCVSVLVLLSLRASDRSALSVHILKLRWSLFFIGSTKPHTLLLLPYISILYTSATVDMLIPTQNLGTYALEG